MFPAAPVTAILFGGSLLMMAEEAKDLWAV